MTEMDYLHRTWVEIDVNAILNNLWEIKKISRGKGKGCNKICRGITTYPIYSYAKGGYIHLHFK